MRNNNYANNFDPDYRLDVALQIFRRADYVGIPYSDGYDAETRLERIVTGTIDRSVLSDSLRASCTDWVTTYHLSPMRANIVRPFSKDLCGAEVLEVGAGCGAITRFLGESGAHVLAVEGSIRRARIARLRTLDLANVKVLAERFSDFRTERRFDFVTLIGVLEYANLYSSSRDPVAEMLGRTHQLLKPGGRLIIAIENQLGLKYFAGALEDHLSERMLGIEGRYQRGGVRTFGRQELERRVLASGFAETELLLPFPDYKLPTSIIAATAFSHRDFKAAAIAAQSVRRDPQLPHQPFFAPERVWPQIASNGIAPDLSNSLLLIAYASPRSAKIPGPLAWHFATNRKATYCKQTIFEQQDNGQILLRNHRLGPPSEDDHMSLGFSPEPEAPYFVGQLLSEELLSIVAIDGWSTEAVVTFFKTYHAIVCEIASAEVGQPPDPAEYDIDVPGSLIDAVPHNLIRLADGDWRFFDREWRASERVPFRYLVFRSITSLAGDVTTIGRPEDPRIDTWGELVASVFDALSMAPFYECRNDLVARESGLHKCVFGATSDQAIQNLLDMKLPTRNDIFQRVERSEAIISNLTGEVNSKNAEVSLLRTEMGRLNQLLSSAQRLAHRTGKFPFSVYFRKRKKYRKILREIREAPHSNLSEAELTAQVSAACARLEELVPLQAELARLKRNVRSKSWLLKQLVTGARQSAKAILLRRRQNARGVIVEQSRACNHAGYASKSGNSLRTAIARVQNRSFQKFTAYRLAVAFSPLLPQRLSARLRNGKEKYRARSQFEDGMPKALPSLTAMDAEILKSSHHSYWAPKDYHLHEERLQEIANRLNEEG